MTVTGDWTVVEDSNSNCCSSNNSNSNDAMQEPSPKKTAAVRFPCMEQPPRYALRSAKTGIYLGGTKRGRLVGRSKRTENDEWTIALVGRENSVTKKDETSSSQGTNSSTVTIHNHKHGNILSMVLTDKSDLGRMAACVSPSGKEETKVVKENDLGLTPSEEEENNETEQLAGDEDEDEDEIVMPSNLDKEDMQWCVIRCSEEDHPNGGVVIVSIKTGDCLSVSDSGQIILSPYEPFHVWEMECVTGELCFLSNPSLDARVRCDMAGMLTLSPNWKGWEVVRITEAEAPHSSTGGGNYTKGYVRISSWMHSQWFLCSDAKGIVSACSVADALLCPDEAQDTVYRCSKWAIEKYPTDENSKHEGLIIRSVTHGRLLSIQDGLLKTYDSLDATRTATMESSTATNVATSSVNSNGDIGDMVKHHTEEMKKRTSQWWKQSLTNVQKTISDQAIQRRNSKMLASGQVPVGQLTGSVPEEETIVWQLESAHLQTYYFISSSDTDGNPSAPKSIGAFPTVTENLRKSDKIQLVKNDDFPDILKLFLPDENYFITCTSKGNILATNQMEDEGLEWILEERETGSVFQSKAHGLYLSFQTEESKTPPAAAFQQGENKAQDAKPKKKNPFENIKLPHQRPKPPISELCATESPTLWNLEPCTPRAISSKRLKTFAIGTSIAVGTTIAMPFAIAGVAAAMGALGAEAGIGFGIVAAAATGAEALASVGAIGATAYFCFRPEQNSLGDDLEDEPKASNPWSKRPFSNWRKW
eukprot:CAMPEP_0116112744 /NCGR_PEP_ID=MMETSP0327-20121206/19143_1 /TAXON_ID=44447 /ORGANISM="Pseudo-nitzschia delicatissima, Strain B596" /LENGTH=759 /DNA_ID=CAMNT_0003606065 /DNA_START=52 /DNA_END=2331 /DNA_ORIENTATION=-